MYTTSDHATLRATAVSLAPATYVRPNTVRTTITGNGGDNITRFEDGTVVIILNMLIRLTHTTAEGY